MPSTAQKPLRVTHIIPGKSAVSILVLQMGKRRRRAVKSDTQGPLPGTYQNCISSSVDRAPEPESLTAPNSSASEEVWGPQNPQAMTTLLTTLLNCLSDENTCPLSGARRDPAQQTAFPGLYCHPSNSQRRQALPSLLSFYSWGN